jgi:hypothetical protein
MCLLEIVIQGTVVEIFEILIPIVFTEHKDVCPKDILRNRKIEFHKITVIIHRSIKVIMSGSIHFFL